MAWRYLTGIVGTYQMIIIEVHLTSPPRHICIIFAFPTHALSITSSTPIVTILDGGYLPVCCNAWLSDPSHGPGSTTTPLTNEQVIILQFSCMDRICEQSIICSP